MTLEQFANLAQTTLAGAIAAGATSITVASAANFPAAGQFRVLVDAEIFLVTGVTGNRFTVIPGYEGTTPSAHSNGAALAHILTAGVVGNFYNHNLGQVNFYEISPSSIGSTADVTTALQDFLLTCQLYALGLKGNSLDDQGQRLYVTAYLPRATYYISSPLIVPELVNLKCDGFIIRNGISGTVTATYTGDTTTHALANLYQPAVICVPRAHIETLNLYCNPDNVNLGSGLFSGKNWVPASASIAAGGSGYHVGDVLTFAQPSKAPYVATQVTVSSVNGAGAVTAISYSFAGAGNTAGSYALPPVLQEQQWTAANGFFVFDPAINGAFKTTGGYGAGAEFTLAWAPDWASGNNTYYGGAELVGDTHLGHIRVVAAGGSYDPTYYGSMYGVCIYGLNTTIDEIETNGGNVGISLRGCSDVRANKLNAVVGDIAIQLFGAGSVSCPNVVIDSASSAYLKIDESQDIDLRGHLFWSEVNDGYSGQGASGYAIVIGEGGSTSALENVGLNLEFVCQNAGSPTPGNPTLYLDYTKGSKIDLKITNYDVNGAAANKIQTGYCVFGIHADSSNELRGSIDNVSGSIFSGTIPACGIWIWDASVSGYAGPGGTYDIIGTGAPANGAGGTGANKAWPGSYYTDTAAKNIYVNNGTASSPAWALVGTVTSVAMTGDGTIFGSSVSGSPVTTNGTLAPALLTQARNTVLAGPASGSNAAPTFRALAASDLPLPTASSIGGVQAVAGVTHQWVNAISTSGVPSLSQPAASDISGLGSIATQAASGVAITGGSINGTTLGATTAAAGNFTTVNVSSSGSAFQIAGANAVSFPSNDTTAGASIAIGPSALSGQSGSAAGYENVAIGGSTMTATMGTGAIRNTALGYGALLNNTGNRNLGIGVFAGQNISSGAQNVFIGGSAASGQGNALTGNNNVGIGYGVLSKVTGTGGGNTVIGQGAGTVLTSGGPNVIIGQNVASTMLTTGNSNILIGNSASVDTPGTATANYLNIGALITGSMASGAQQVTFAGAEANGNKSVQVPVTGFSITVANNVSYQVLDPAGTLATGTIITPASPVDGQKLVVASSQAVTSLTVSANTGQSIKNAPTALSAGGAFGYMYNLANTTWYRIE